MVQRLSVDSTRPNGERTRVRVSVDRSVRIAPHDDQFRASPPPPNLRLDSSLLSPLSLERDLLSFQYTQPTVLLQTNKQKSNT